MPADPKLRNYIYRPTNHRSRSGPRSRYVYAPYERQETRRTKSSFSVRDLYELTAVAVAVGVLLGFIALMLAHAV